MTVALDEARTRAYGAMTGHAAMVDRSSRMRMAFIGEKAKETLGGLLTNDITALTPGGGMRAAALTPKGRVIALLRVFDRGDDLLVDADGAAGAGFTAMIRKYVNPRLARHVELSASTGSIGVYGPGSAEALAQLVEMPAEALDGLSPHAHVTTGTADERITVLRSADFAVPGFDVIATAPRIAALLEAGRSLGLVELDDDVAEVARIEAGVPRWGIEMDEETLPQEANLDALGAISFDKGCYTGQEVVARIHFRGHVNRHLRRLLSAVPVEPGASVRDAEGKDVGDVRSAAMSPARGGIALAMVRREVAPGGEVLVAHADGRAIPATIEAIA